MDKSRTSLNLKKNWGDWKNQAQLNALRYLILTAVVYVTTTMASLGNRFVSIFFICHAWDVFVILLSLANIINLTDSIQNEIRLVLWSEKIERFGRRCVVNSLILV